MPGLMKNAPLRFLLDGGKHIAISEKDYNVYEFNTTYASNPLTRSVLLHVVPYGQNSVEDSLMEEDAVTDPIIVSHNPQNE